MFEQRTGCLCRADDRDLIPFLTRLEQIMLKKSTLGIYLSEGSLTNHIYSWNWFKQNIDLDTELDLVAFQQSQSNDQFISDVKTKKPIERRAKTRKNLVSFHLITLRLPKENLRIVIEFINQLPVRLYSGKRTQISSILIAKYPYYNVHVNNACILGFHISPHINLFQVKKCMDQGDFYQINDFINGILSIPIQHLKIWIYYGCGISEIDRLIEAIAIQRSINAEKKSIHDQKGTCLDIPRIFPTYSCEDGFVTLIEIGLYNKIKSSEKPDKTGWSSFLLEDLYDPRLLGLIIEFVKEFLDEEPENEELIE